MGARGAHIFYGSDGLCVRINRAAAAWRKYYVYAACWWEWTVQTPFLLLVNKIEQGALLTVVYLSVAMATR